MMPLSHEPRVLAVDPGATTGYAFFNEESDLLATGEIVGGPEAFIEFLYSDRRVSKVRTIVVETFVIDGTITGAWAPEIVGLLRLWCYQKEAMLVIQFRTDKATLFGQLMKGPSGEVERFNWLRERGFSGSAHELDAITHGLVYFKRQRNRNVLDRYFNE